MSQDRFNALARVIDTFAEYNNFSQNELILNLSFMLKRAIKKNVQVTIDNIELAPFSLEIHKKAKETLNECINEIDKKRSTLRSVSHQLRKQRK